MRIGVKRLEEHGQRAVRIIHPKSGRGLAFLYDVEDGTGLRFIRNGDVEEIIRGDVEKTMDYMIKEDYLPIEIPNDEFERLHEQTARFPLFKEEDNFKQIKFPQIKKLIEQDARDYHAQIEQFCRQQNLYQK